MVGTSNQSVPEMAIDINQPWFQYLLWLLTIINYGFQYSNICCFRPMGKGLTMIPIDGLINIFLMEKSTINGHFPLLC